MRTFALLFICAALAFHVARSQTATIIPAIQPAEASKHAGEEVYLEGLVASVHASAKGAAFINLGEAYPHQVFTGFIQNLNAIGDEAWLNGLKGKTIRIRGRINIYHTIPEIRITSKDQVVSK